MRHKAHHKKRGFSIIEVLIAIGVVATGVLALMAVFIAGTRSNQHGRDLSRAVLYGRKISEIIRADGLGFPTGGGLPDSASGLNDDPGVFRALEAAPIAFNAIRLPLLNDDGTPQLDSGNVVIDSGDDKYERHIEMEAAGAPGTYNDAIVELDVTIRWQGGKIGDGMRKITVTSLLKAPSS